MAETNAGPVARDAQAAPPSLWRNRDFVLLWSGQVLSTLGTRTSAVAVPLIVLAMTGSPGRAGVAGFVATLPYLLFYLPAGAVLDRLDRGHVMLWCEAVRVLALGSIPVALWLDRLTYTQLLVAGFVGGTCFVFFSVAEKSVLPSLVSPEQLTPALAQQEAKSRGAGLAGPPLGGLLYGVSHALPFLADALSYVASFATLAFIRVDLRVRRPEPAGPWWREVGAGVRWLVGQPFIRVTVGCSALTNVMFQALTLVVIVLARHLGASAAVTGAVLGFFGCGGLAGAFAAPWIQRRLPPRAVVIGATWLWLALLVPIAAVPTPQALGPLVAVMAFVNPVWNVVAVGYQYKVIPDHLLGRVKSVVLLVSWGAIPFGSLIAGALLDAVGPRAAVLALSGLSLLVAVVATASPGIRKAVVLAER
ncbi:MFS transporter [Streptomyces sp. NPDC047081]|uniref:MFS transporter n=1 Tax=Streptomyces sp. NPDC047081 TaxID=3154706 RepID=UPI0033FDC62B